MDLKEILAISGKGGLFKVIAENKAGVIVESLIDNKRIQAYATDKISNLEEISVFTDQEDMPLKEVFKKVFEKENGGKTPDPKSDRTNLREYFESVLPEFDKEKVYNSDIRKILVWYNILQENNLLDFTEVTEDEEKKEEEIVSEENSGKEETDVTSNENDTEIEKTEKIEKKRKAPKQETDE